MTNKHSQPGEKDIKNFHSKYTILEGTWHIYVAIQIERIYHIPPIPKGYGDCAIGIFEEAFKCGLRVPLLPLLRILFKQMNIALGQMDPNGFIHINFFQNGCLKTGLPPFICLFWFHYDFRKNPKSFGFYTIARRSGRTDCVAPIQTIRRAILTGSSLAVPNFLTFASDEWWIPTSF